VESGFRLSLCRCNVEIDLMYWQSIIYVLKHIRSRIILDQAPYLSFTSIASLVDRSSSSSLGVQSSHSGEEDFLVNCDKLSLLFVLSVTVSLSAEFFCL
jgi:hypothetical protein